MTETRAPKRGYLITAIALAAIAVIIGALGLNYRHLAGRFASEGVATDAVVLVKKLEENHEADPRYLLQLGYADEQGNKLQGWDAVPHSLWDSLTENQRVPVTYLRSTPTTVRLASAGPPPTGAGQLILAAVAAAAALMLYLVSRWIGRRVQATVTR